MRKRTSSKAEEKSPSKEPKWRDSVWYVFQKSKEDSTLPRRSIMWIETRESVEEAQRRAGRMNRCPTSESDQVEYFIAGPFHESVDPFKLFRE